jgi:hypothetical protein
VIKAEKGVGMEEVDHNGSGMYCLPFMTIGRSELEEEGDWVVESGKVGVNAVTWADASVGAQEDGVSAREDDCGQGFLAR